MPGQTSAPAPAGKVRLRRIAVGVLVVITTLALFASILAIWSYRQVLNTDVFVDRVDSILDDRRRAGRPRPTTSPTR